MICYFKRDMRIQCATAIGLERMQYMYLCITPERRHRITIFFVLSHFIHDYRGRLLSTHFISFHFIFYEVV